MNARCGQMIALAVVGPGTGVASVLVAATLGVGFIKAIALAVCIGAVVGLAAGAAIRVLARRVAQGGQE